jgi:ferredoxin
MIKVNKNKCIGCSLCISICEEVFEMDKDGKSRVKSQKNVPCVKQAADSCPVEAISY